MTRQDVAELPGRMPLWWREDAEREESQAFVDFGEGWLVPARLVRRTLLRAYDGQEPHTPPPPVSPADDWVPDF